MLPCYWGLLGFTLLIAFSNGASINSALDHGVGEVRRFKRSYKRGQTQSQYLNFGQPELDGKAEAEATETGSRSTVSGTHGMGQAQSQFSSGDCSGCGVGSPVYEYSTGSPDPLTMGGNVGTYSDGKPSSIIGLQGITPSGSFGGSFSPSTSVLTRRPEAAGTSTSAAGKPVGQPGVSGGFSPGTILAGAPGSLPTGGAGQIARPGVDSGYVPGGAYVPSGSSSGHIGRPGTSGVYAPDSTFVPRTGDSGQSGRPGTDSAFTHSGPYAPSVIGPQQTAKPDGTPGSTYLSNTGQPGVSGGFSPGTILVGGPGSPGTGGTGQIGRPGVDGAYVPVGAYAPGGSDAGSIGRPSTGSTYPTGGTYVPSTGGVGQTGRHGTDGAYAPGGASPGQLGRPGPIGVYGPESTNVPSAGSRGQLGTPDIDSGYTSGGAYPPRVSGEGQTGRSDLPSTYITGQQPGPQLPGYGQVAGQQIPTYIPGGQDLLTYGTNGNRPVGQPSYGKPIHGTQVLQPDSFYRPSSGFAPGQQIPQRGTEQQVFAYPQKPGYAGGYGAPIDGGSGSVPVGAVQHGAQYPVTGPHQISQQPGLGAIIPPASFQPGYGPQGRIQSTGGFVQPSGAQPGTSDQYGRVHAGAGSPQIGAAFPQSGTGSASGAFEPSSAGQPSPGHVQPATVYDQQTGTIYGQKGIIPGQQGSVVQPSRPSSGAGIGYPSGPESFSQQRGKAGSAIPPFAVQREPDYAAGSDPRTGSSVGYHPQGGIYSYPDQSGIPPGRMPSVGTQSGLPSLPEIAGKPATGFGPQIGGQPRVGIQPSVQPEAGFGQYPGGGFSQPGASYIPILNRGVQQGADVQQGSGYDTSFAQRPISQPGYGQPTGVSQYGQPGTQLPGAGLGQGPQEVIQPGSTYIPGGGIQPSGLQQQGAAGLGAPSVSGPDDSFSQAESSIGNGQAAASAQGKKNGGTAKTQVQGTYSSSGSFSASAMTSDNDRSSSSQVTGGVEGAMSQSQGQGGAAQSQAQVQINEKTGGTKASSQSGGIIHQSQSEVQANDKGGLADAQSSGPGQTSSQAQIGFRPGQEGEIVRSAGGGQASAQSGIHSGNSQSQIQGTSKYGVSYHGAAQSASGTKEQVATYRAQNRDLFNTISQFGTADAVTDRVDTVYNPSLTSESDIPDLQLKASRTNKEATSSNKLDDESTSPDEEEEEPYDEYEEEEDYYNENPVKMESKSNSDKKLQSSPLHRTHTQTSPTQTQQVAVADSTKKYNVIQNQNGRVQTYPSRTTTETVPNGFRGTVNVEKKFHTKSLESHKSENKLNITADGVVTGQKPRTPDSFVTVTKSITGSMDNSKNPPQDNKNFQSTYYTKSSTCGYFTFSCNIVYGANGRSKICRPKAPTNGKC